MALLLPGAKYSLQSTYPYITIILESLNYCANKLPWIAEGRSFNRLADGCDFKLCSRSPLSAVIVRVPQGCWSKPSSLPVSETEFYQYCLHRNTLHSLLSEQHKKIEHDMISAEDLVAGYPDAAHQHQLESERCLYKYILTLYLLPLSCLGDHICLKTSQQHAAITVNSRP